MKKYKGLENALENALDVVVEKDNSKKLREIGEQIEVIDCYEDYVFINKRYKIYYNDGCVYDTKEAKDIPQYIFNFISNFLKK